MSDIVIRAEGVGKKYLIGHQTERESYTTLRDVLGRNARDYWRKAKALARGEQIVQGDTQEEIWALREVSFEIRQGEAVGIIGRNGAGKSTLLKILSRITEPSAGRVTIRGRVASLLEVGTGFHPELSGRENIYLNGAILGMTRQEIKRKFDEIVDFAEVEKFLDTPVKRYSSGMYVRLAFAVAAHLEPEILVVDEVLAVGDAAFQKKCLGKMGDVAKGGRTVLFVSHNLGAVRSLCSHGLLLESGVLSSNDLIGIVLNKYSFFYTSSIKGCWDIDDNKNLPLQVTNIKIINKNGEVCSNFDTNDRIRLLITHVCYKKLMSSVVLVSVYYNGIELIHSFDTDSLPNRLACREIGNYIDLITLPINLFKPGILTFSIRTALVNKNTTFQDKKDVLSISIHNQQEDTTFKGYMENREGLLRVPLQWEPNKLI